MASDSSSSILPEGSLDTRPFSSILYTLHKSGFTGTLHVHKPDVRKEVFFESGLVKFAASSREEERFGQILCRTGRITTGQLEYAIEASKKTEGGAGKLGRTLVQMGFMKPPEVLSALRDQIREIVVDVFTWEEGGYRLDPSALRADDEVKVSLDMNSLVREGTQRITNPVFLLQIIGSMDTELRLAPSALAAMKGFSPVPKEQQVIQFASRGMRLRDLCNMLPYPAVETCQLVLNLITFGVLERSGGLG
jgi:hypothetical protein